MCGCHEAGWYLVRDLLLEGMRFDYFVSLTPSQAEEYQVSGYKDFTDLAETYSIPVYYPQTYTLKSEQDRAFFQKNRFDLLIQGGWQRLFPEQVIQTLSIGAIGIHGSPDFLPKGRGRSPMNWALIQNKKRFMMHLFFIEPGVDDGAIIDIEPFDINEFDNIRTLYYKYSIVKKRMLLRSLPLILSGTIQTMPQVGEPSYYPKRTPEDGHIDWENMDVWEIYNLVRAVTRPYPGAFGMIDNRKYLIWECQIFDTRITYPDAAYGTIVERFDRDLIVNCRGGLMLLKDYEIC